jgi:hypothetical protein
VVRVAVHHAGYELVAAGKLIMAAGRDGKPMDMRRWSGGRARVRAEDEVSEGRAVTECGRMPTARGNQKPRRIGYPTGFWPYRLQLRLAACLMTRR